ncbi:Flavocytochrome c [Basidiobolus meristosporus CBS 931.73]|uniref:Fumarate reductase n=1 Tax=Basidiobolus meristosporus CBS 931.73 TaxID=1314790 RepID=A0A1Y1YVC1_9FUNG|nr:Flavocytochrome c [Basidiobolus meristosporus CBS 931.73]|eukprot:ORY01525.1 Flavocytochrome c [Basidiobolus meristosporus CBS 931.73]
MLHWLVLSIIVVALAYYYVTLISLDQHTPSVIIVGGGLAGLSAALEAYNLGAKVTLIEKEANLGGNSAKATSGINGVPTRVQALQGVEDTVEKFARDTEISGGTLSDMELVQVLTSRSNEAVEWIQQFTQGMNLSALSQCGGHSEPRTHRFASKEPGKPALPVGFGIIKMLSTHLRGQIKSEDTEEPRIRILTSTTAYQLITSNKGMKMKVAGVSVVKDLDGRKEYEELLADGVILTTGGYGASALIEDASKSLIKEYAPHVVGLPTTNGAWAQGDGVRLARDPKVDAELIHMDQVQVHPTGFVDLSDPANPTKFLAPEALRGYGGVLINGRGDRFVNELGPRDYVTQHIFEFCSPEKNGLVHPKHLENPLPLKAACYMILPDSAVESYDRGTVGFYMGRGLIHKAANLSELSDELNLSVEHLTKTLQDYDDSLHGKLTDPYGKTVFPGSFIDGGPYYYAVITPSIHYTMGGVKINSNTQVLRSDGQPIPGLFAAGEVTGGVHGKNRLAGNSLLECVVYGRISGASALRPEFH